MPTCTAFTTKATPCTNAGHMDVGLCGLHRHMVATPVLREEFNRKQARLRATWERRQEVAPPQVTASCIAIKSSGDRCTKNAVHPDGKCGAHHSLDIRRAEEIPMKAAQRSIGRMGRHNTPAAVIDAYVTQILPTIVPRLHSRVQMAADNAVLSPFVNQIRAVIGLIGTTREQVDMVIDAYVLDGFLSERRAVLLQEFVNWEFMMRDHRAAFLQQAAGPMPGPNQREAQLAADSQNVHTPEVGKQMNDSLAILLAIEVPITQQDTTKEILASWQRQGHSLADITTVYHDLVGWWNKTLIFVAGDKTYKRALRGLWWTIKQYKGEVRDELEKRLWDECRDAAIPYSVCAQGHLARLTNVMVGFDDAFVPPVPIGEILQQKMAAISEMDIEYDQQIKMAEEVLAELKIPAAEHSNWLAAF